MSTFTLFGPILIICILIIFIIGARRVWRPDGRKIKLLILTYVGILLLSLPTTYIINSLLEEQSGEQMIELAHNANREFHQAIEEGRLPSAEHIQAKEQWIVPYEEDRPLRISVRGRNEVDWIMVSRNEQLPKHQINVSYYTTPHVVNNFDYTHLVGSPEVTVIDNNLIIRGRNDQTKLELIGFRREFYIDRFVAGDGDGGHVTFRGRELIYLEVPPHLELEVMNNMELIYID